jgi:hypothetical protein
MRTRTVALALITAWVCTCLNPAPVDATRLPTKPLEPGYGGPRHDSDPWVPDGELPSRTLSVQQETLDDERLAAPPAQPTRTDGWFLRLLRVLRSLSFGGGR